MQADMGSLERARRAESKYISKKSVGPISPEIFRSIGLWVISNAKITIFLKQSTLERGTVQKSLQISLQKWQTKRLRKIVEITEAEVTLWVISNIVFVKWSTLGQGTLHKGVQKIQIQTKRLQILIATRSKKDKLQPDIRLVGSALQTGLTLQKTQVDQDLSLIHI